MNLIQRQQNFNDANTSQRHEMKVPYSYTTYTTYPFRTRATNQLYTDLGLLFAGFNPAVPVDTMLNYECPDDEVFLHHKDVTPEVSVYCQTNGFFTIPTLWPVCKTRTSCEIVFIV